MHHQTNSEKRIIEKTLTTTCPIESVSNVLKVHLKILLNVKKKEVTKSANCIKKFIFKRFYKQTIRN